MNRTPFILKGVNEHLHCLNDILTSGRKFVNFKVLNTNQW